MGGATGHGTVIDARGALSSGGFATSACRDRGAKRGANRHRRRAAYTTAERQSVQVDGSSSNDRRYQATAQLCLLSSGSQVRSLPGAPTANPRSEHLLGTRILDTHEAGSPCRATSVPDSTSWPWPPRGAGASACDTIGGVLVAVSRGRSRSGRLATLVGNAAVGGANPGLMGGPVAYAICAEDLCRGAG